MKKMSVLIVVLTLLLTACGSSETKISADKAKEIALNHAGVLKEDATFLRAERDSENGKAVYEVEFYSKDKKEYDYEIDANTGEILSYDSDAESATTAQNGGEQSAAAEVTEITEDKAREIALAKVPGATGENIREFKKEFDDGREEYDGKIIYNKTEYEFEIDAKTGEIITWESESVFD